MVTFDKLSHKRLRLHVPDKAVNVIPNKIYPTPTGNYEILKAKRLTDAMKLCTGSPKTVSDKLRFSRLSAGFHQKELGDKLEIDRTTLLRYETGKVTKKIRSFADFP